MRSKNTTAIFAKLLVLCCAALLHACSSDNDSSARGNDSTNQLSGRAIKGIITAAEVRAYPIVESGSAYVIDNREAVALGVTDTKGNYSLSFTASPSTTLYYLELRSSSASQILCDLPSGCPTDSVGNTVAYNQFYGLPAGFVLSGFLDLSSSASKTVHLSPLSHIAVTRAMGMAGGVSPANLIASYRHIENLFDLESGSLDIAPPDITNEEESRAASTTALKLGIYSAAFANLINNDSWESLESLPFAEIYESVIDTTSYLTQTSSGGYQAQLNDISASAEANLADLRSEDITIIVQPSSADLAAGSDYTLEVVATSDLSLNYQWFRDGEPVSGATSNQLQLSDLSVDQVGVYTVSISNSSTNILSLAALISIDEEASSPRILEQPRDQSITEGGTANFSVSAAGSGFLIYQWRKDGANISGANASSLSLENLDLNDGGIYSVRIANAYGSVVSGGANLTVLQAPDPIEITEQPTSRSAVEGDSVSFSVVAEGTGPINYQWQKNGTLLVGENSSTLSISNTTLSDAGSYAVTISNEVSSVLSNFASLSVSEAIAPISITSHPQSTTVEERQTLSLSVSASGGGFISYQWRKDGTPIDTQLGASLIIENTNLADAGYYDVVLTNPVGSIISNGATVTVNPYIAPVEITQHPISTSITESESVTLFVSASGGGTLSYQWQKDGEDLIGENESSLTISDAIPADSGTYYVTVRNSVGSEESLSAEIDVAPLPVIPSTVTIEWDIPTERVDGSVLELSEIAGYEIEYGFDEVSPENRLNTSSATSNSIDLTLFPGVYYIRIATTDDLGLTGEFSPITSFVIE